VSETTPVDAARLDHLRGLLSVADAVRAGDDLTSVLEAVARAICDGLGFSYAVVNLRRPAWDDFQVVVVHGDAAAADLLMGQVTTLPDWGLMLDPRFERHNTYLVPAGHFDWEDERIVSFRPPPRDGAHEPGGWHPDDALLVPLRDARGELVGVLSVDDPADGRRPTDPQREVLCALAAHAAIAVDHARAAAEARRHRNAMEHLLRVSAPLTAGMDPAEALGAACAAVHDALDFEKVTMLLADGEERTLRVAASIGWSPAELAGFPLVEVEALERVLHPALAQDGCIVLTREQGEAVLPEALRALPASRRDGRGPLAWDGHCVLVPLQDSAGDTLGLLYVGDPGDRLLPTQECRRALRAFANHAMGTLAAARRLEELRRLAEHDPLTGLRNRRSFEPGLDADLRSGARVALLVCDLDHFKRVNDSLGHEAGDEVLRRFARVLRACARHADLPTRLGGEEFALVLRDADAAGALALGERLRRAVRGEFAGFPVPVSVSVGIAATTGDLREAPQLARAAHRALYAAKRLGRDRCVTYERHLAEIVSTGEEGASREQLAAAILLAETLDLRDGGTSRHSQIVARLAERTGLELGWPATRVERLRAAGLLHDIGKLGISDAILHKADGLAPEEWEEIRRHPEVGARILEHANLPDIGEWVLAHHERVDGRGYPYGLAAAQIPAESRILAVADAYEAMVADRPYRAGLPAEHARAELARGAGTQFDAEIVSSFLRALGSPLAPLPAG